MEQSQQERATFDFKQCEEAAVEQLRQDKPLEGEDGGLAPLIKRLVEASLAGEMDAPLAQPEGEESDRNRHNGTMSKRVKTGFGTVEIGPPRKRLLLSYLRIFRGVLHRTIMRRERFLRWSSWRDVLNRGVGFGGIGLCVGVGWNGIWKNVEMRKKTTLIEQGYNSGFI